MATRRVVLEALVARPLGVLRRGGREGHAEEGGRFAREADVAEPVGAIGRQPDLEDGVARRGDGVDQARARRAGAGRQDEDAVAVGAEAELRLAAEHPLAGDAGDVRRSIVMPFAGKCAPSGARTTRPPASGTLGAPQTTSCCPSPRSTVTRRRPLRDGCGRVETTRRHEAGLGAESERGHSFDLEARGGEARGDRRRVVGERRTELTEPADRGFHRPARRSSARTRGRGWETRAACGYHSPR